MPAKRPTDMRSPPTDVNVGTHNTTKAASINAVAEYAGVSIATVSRVLNSSKPVNAHTRERVEAAVEALGYRANMFARSLMRGESHLLLVLMPDFANPFFSETVKGIESVARRQGYNIVLSGAPDTLAREGHSLDILYNRLVDGVISLANYHDLPRVLRDVPNLPWVSCSEFNPESHVPHVSIDHEQAAVDAVQYLINRGHRRIALLGADENYAWARQRRAGYEMALRRAGLVIEPQLIRIARGTDYSFGMEAAGALLAQESPPTSVFAVSDTLAIGAIKAFRRAGRRVPEDIAVVGFDNIPLSQVFEPALTTIAQPMFELGAEAANLLLERLAGGAPGSRTLQHSLVVRESA
ncbi:LacI family DNA-binding transcriptional regulator [Telluria mixta]|uniref:LacI family DNA-binding transcriptional regulator n=1 Tax=Telluria mixta TaxID=34071 RepID=A0ABT2BS16_9BURK|nr:LacI family DNA-binding transcriptional regulator [Telluria mixta]MCS0627913.1 LacI family DNA-binding transcriptional regulator [Telluria mixta]WEM93968.1 LacI family DNA-binding transcriptional regulator [Telluria mixta]